MGLWWTRPRRPCRPSGRSFLFYKSLSSYAHIVANYLQVFMRSQLSLGSALRYLGKLRDAGVLG